MPVYSFRCTHCGNTDERVRAMKNCNKACKCKCGEVMSRDIPADVPFVSGGEYHKAIHSDSLAISPDQVAEHKKLFPNIKLDNECRPIFDNFKDHDSYLKKCGFKKERQKIKHRKTKKLPTSKVAGGVAK